MLSRPRPTYPFIGNPIEGRIVYCWSFLPNMNASRNMRENDDNTNEICSIAYGNSQASKYECSGRIPSLSFIPFFFSFSISTKKKFSFTSVACSVNNTQCYCAHNQLPTLIIIFNSMQIHRNLRIQIVFITIEIVRNHSRNKYGRIFYSQKECGNAPQFRRHCVQSKITYIYLRATRVKLKNEDCTLPTNTTTHSFVWVLYLYCSYWMFTPPFWRCKYLFLQCSLECRILFEFRMKPAILCSTCMGKCAYKWHAFNASTWRMARHDSAKSLRAFELLSDFYDTAINIKIENAPEDTSILCIILLPLVDKRMQRIISIPDCLFHPRPFRFIFQTHIYWVPFSSSALFCSAHFVLCTCDAIFRQLFILFPSFYYN